MSRIPTVSFFLQNATFKSANLSSTRPDEWPFSDYNTIIRFWSPSPDEVFHSKLIFLDGTSVDQNKVCSGDSKRRRRRKGREVDGRGCADRRRRPCRWHEPTARRSEREKEKGRKGKWWWLGGGAGVAVHASHLIRRSRVCPVHVDVSLRASVAGERQELPRAWENHTVLKTSQGTLWVFNAGQQWVILFINK